MRLIYIYLCHHSRSEYQDPIISDPNFPVFLLFLTYPEHTFRLEIHNTEHPLFNDIRSIVMKSTGIDKVFSDIIKRVGNLDSAFVRGDYASGIDSGLIDLVLIGESVNQKEIERVRIKTEKLISRKISILILSKSEYNKLEATFSKEPKLILYGKL